MDLVLRGNQERLLRLSDSCIHAYSSFPPRDFEEAILDKDLDDMDESSYKEYKEILLS